MQFSTKVRIPDLFGILWHIKQKGLSVKEALSKIKRSRHIIEVLILDCDNHLVTSLYLLLYGTYHYPLYEIFLHKRVHNNNRSYGNHNQCKFNKPLIFFKLKVAHDITCS
jgi:hypothetical protein